MGHCWNDWDSQNFCWLSLVFFIDWRVGFCFVALFPSPFWTSILIKKRSSDFRVPWEVCNRYITNILCKYICVLIVIIIIDTDSNNQIDFEIFEKHDPIMDQQISLSDFANNKIHWSPCFFHLGIISKPQICLSPNPKYFRATGRLFCVSL